jgi:hypothetical protein
MVHEGIRGESDQGYRKGGVYVHSFPICMHHGDQGCADNGLDCRTCSIALTHALQRRPAEPAVFTSGDAKGGHNKVPGTLKCFNIERIGS